MKRWLLLVTVLPLLATSQTRHECWVRVNTTVLLDKHWSAGLDLLHRSQANYRNGDKNIFHYPLGNLARLWVYYQLPENWTLLLSPFAWLRNNDIEDAKGDLKETEEIRLTGGVVKTIGHRSVKNKNRLLVEERFIQYNDPLHFTQVRLRFQNSLSVPLFSVKNKQALSATFYNEVMVKKDKYPVLFDQERIYGGLQWIHRGTSLDAGYQWVLQKSDTRTFHRNQLYIQLNLRFGKNSSFSR